MSDRTDVLLEGGPTLAGAFLRAGVINRILAYVAPILLGGPVTAVDDVGVSSMAQALRWQFDGVDRVGPDLVLSLVLARRLSAQSTGRRPRCGSGISGSLPRARLRPLINSPSRAPTTQITTVALKMSPYIWANACRYM